MVLVNILGDEDRPNSRALNWKWRTLIPHLITTLKNFCESSWIGICKHAFLRLWEAIKQFEGRIAFTVKIVSIGNFL